MASSRGARRNADATDSEVGVAVGVAVVVVVVVGVGMKPPTPDADAAFINIVCRLRMLSRNCANLGTDGIYTYDSTGLAILEIANQLETGAAGRTSGTNPAATELGFRAEVNVPQRQRRRAEGGDDG